RGCERLEPGSAVQRSHDLAPAAIRSRRHTIHLVERIVAVFRLPEKAGHRIERQPESVASAIREDLVDVRDDVVQLRGGERHTSRRFERGDLLDGHLGERVVGRRGALGVESEDGTSQVSVIRRWTAELIVRMSWAEGTADQILQLSAPAVVADLEVQLAVRTE